MSIVKSQAQAAQQLFEKIDEVHDEVERMIDRGHLLTTDQVKDQLNITHQGVSWLAKSGKINGRKMPHWVFTRSSVDAYASGRSE